MLSLWLLRVIIARCILDFMMVATCYIPFLKSATSHRSCEINYLSQEIYSVGPSFFHIVLCSLIILPYKSRYSEEIFHDE